MNTRERVQIHPFSLGIPRKTQHSLVIWLGKHCKTGHMIIVTRDKQEYVTCDGIHGI